eukprot:m.95529 g.95529  ORF g.95529 m.95529 type:complete len:100 (-) comp8950_c0_seq2:11-310(-)
MLVEKLVQLRVAIYVIHGDRFRNESKRMPTLSTPRFHFKTSLQGQQRKKKRKEKKKKKKEYNQMTGKYLPPPPALSIFFLGENNSYSLVGWKGRRTWNA